MTNDHDHSSLVCPHCGYVRPDWTEQAIDILARLACEQPDEAQLLMRGLIDKYGPEVVPALLIFWADMVGHSLGTSGGGGPVTPIFSNIEDGQRNTADTIGNWAWAWAGRVICARLSGDRETFIALVRSVPDNAAWTRGVWAVAQCSALTIVTGAKAEAMTAAQLTAHLDQVTAEANARKDHNA